MPHSPAPLREMLPVLAPTHGWERADSKQVARQWVQWSVSETWVLGPDQDQAGTLLLRHHSILQQFVSGSCKMSTCQHCNTIAGNIVRKLLSNTLPIELLKLICLIMWCVFGFLSYYRSPFIHHAISNVTYHQNKVNSFYVSSTINHEKIKCYFLQRIIKETW